MVYEYVLRLFGKNIVQLISFLPLLFGFGDNHITVTARLTEPVTAETMQLVKQGFTFSVTYEFSFIVNDSKVYRAVAGRNLSFRDNVWYCNDSVIAEANIQACMGEARVVLEGCVLHDGDVVEGFVRASIAPDAVFKKSTGLNTNVLWNCYIPRLRKVYIYKQGAMTDRDD